MPNPVWNEITRQWEGPPPRKRGRPHKTAGQHDREFNPLPPSTLRLRKRQTDAEIDAGRAADVVTMSSEAANTCADSLLPFC